MTLINRTRPRHRSLARVVSLSTLLTVLGGAHEAHAGPITDLIEVDSWDTATSTAPFGLGAVGMALSPARDFLYVVSHYKPGAGEGGTELLVFDTATGLVEGSVQLTLPNVPATHGFATQVALSHDGQWAYVTIAGAQGSTYTAGLDRVEIVDLSQPNAPQFAGSLDASLANPFGATDVVYADGEVYVSSRGNNRVLVFDALTHARSSIGTGGPPYGLALAPDGSTVWVANRNNVSLAGIDTATNSLTSFLPLPLAGVHVTANLAVTPDGASAYVSSWGSPNLSHVDLDNMTPIGQPIATGCSRVGSVASDEAGYYLFAACPEQDQLLVVDADPTSLSYDTVVHAVSVDMANSVDIVVDESDGLRVYVSSAFAEAVSILELCPDQDGDGVCDGDDNCVADANPGQADGDSDGVGDVCDLCGDTQAIFPGLNPVGADGCTAIDACEANANNRGECVSCIIGFINDWRQQQLITQAEAQALRADMNDKNVAPCVQ